MSEQWRQYGEHPIEVSDQGNVLSLAWGRRRPLKPFPNSAGYLQVNWRKDGKRVTRQVSRMVLEAHVGPCPDGMECRHFNGVCTDNRLDNLKWGSRLANLLDSIRHGTFARKLSRTDVRDIYRRLSEGQRQRDVAAHYGVSQVLVCRIGNGRVWSAVTRHDEFGRSASQRAIAAGLTASAKGAKPGVAASRARRAAAERFTYAT